MKKISLLLLIFHVCLYSCKKDPGVKPAATATGSVSGTISPAGAATEVIVTTIVNGQAVAYKAAPGTNGSFIINDLPVATYTLSYTVASGYTAPADTTVSVSAKQNTDAGTITFPAASQTGSISGITTPAGEVSIVTAISKKDITVRYSALADPGTGGFEFTDMPPGTYYLYYYTQDVFNNYTPVTRAIVVRGQNTDVGTIKISKIVPGSISGTVTPAGSVLSVTLSDDNGDLQTVTPDAGGNFKISNITYGDYFVTAKPVAGSGLYAPYRKRVTVPNGENINMGNITLTTTVPPYPVSCSIDGAVYHTQAGGIDSYYSPPDFGVNSYLGDYTVLIILSGVNGTGEYTCSSTTESSIQLYKNSGGTGPVIGEISSWYTSAPGANGVIKITSIDPVTKTISGTFSATVTTGINIPGGTKTITGGTFIVPYQ